MRCRRPSPSEKTNWIPAARRMPARTEFGRSLLQPSQTDRRTHDGAAQRSHRVEAEVSFTLTWMALSTWMFGYPEQAVKISDAQEAHARWLGHPFNLSWSLTYGALLFEHVGEPEELLKRVEEGERVSRENSVQFVTEVLVRLQFGVALIRKGEFTAGVASLKAGRTIWEKGGGRLGVHLKSALAEGMAQLGALDGALDLIGEIIAQIERPGWEERHYYAETLRIKGWVISLKGDLEGAERNYLASLDRARQQTG